MLPPNEEGHTFFFWQFRENKLKQPVVSSVIDSGGGKGGRKPSPQFITAQQ
jgi:hypothetical protein